MSNLQVIIDRLSSTSQDSATIPDFLQVSAGTSSRPTLPSRVDDIEQMPRLQTDMVELTNNKESLNIDCFDCSLPDNLMRFSGLPPKITEALTLNKEDTSLFYAHISQAINTCDSENKVGIIEAFVDAFSTAWALVPSSAQLSVIHQLKELMSQNMTTKVLNDAVLLSSFFGVNLIVYDADEDNEQSFEQSTYQPYVIFVTRNGNFAVIKQRTDNQGFFRYSKWKSTIEHLVGGNRLHPNQASLHLTKYRVEILKKVAESLGIASTRVRSGKIKTLSRPDLLSAIRAHHLSNEKLELVRALLREAEDIKVTK